MDLSTTHFFEVQYVKSGPTTGTVAVTRTDTLHFTSSAEVRMEGDGSITSSAAVGLSAGTVYYFRVRAGNVNGSGDWSDSASATPGAAGDGVWTYGTRVNPSSIRPGGTAELQVIATFKPPTADASSVHTLTASPLGIVSATFVADTPDDVGFVQTGSDTLAQAASDIVEASECSVSSNTLTCTFVFDQLLRANVLGSFVIEVTPAFSITPRLNGFANVVGTPTSDQLPDATLSVRRPSPSNRPPVARGSIDDLSLIESGEPRRVDVQDKFRDPNRDRLTYTASSSDESIATVSVDGSMVTVTPWVRALPPSRLPHGTHAAGEPGRGST